MKGKEKKSSYDVFMSFVGESGDASGILSRNCYDKWVSTRKSELKQPQESFRRVLTAHVCGLIGRKPFPADTEASLLRSLRRKQVWPCFQDFNEVTIGIKGFRKAGFHESRRGIFGPNASSSLLSPTQPDVISINPRLAIQPRKHRRPSEISVPLIDVPHEETEYDHATASPVDLSFQGAKRSLYESGGIDSLFQTVKRLRKETGNQNIYNPNLFLAPGLLQEVQIPVQEGTSQVQMVNNAGWPLVYGDL